MMTKYPASEHARNLSARFDRWSRRAVLAMACATGAVLALPTATANERDGRHESMKWVASWATAPASYYVYSAPVPQNQALGFSATKYALANIQPDLAFPFPDAKTSGATANNQTFRSIIKPDLWGRTMRVKFSNVFGDQTLTLNAVT